MGKTRKLYEAYFLTAKGVIIPIIGKHIDSILTNPRRFGFSRKEIRSVYEKFGELPKYGFEGKGRNQIIFLLLLRGWTRIRIDKNNYINCQIAYSCKKSACRNIFKFLYHVRKTIGTEKYGQMGLRVYEDRVDPLINVYSTSEIKNQLLEQINEV